MDAQHSIVLAADLAVGILLLLGGVLLWRRERAAGTLLAAAGASWLLGFLWPIALFWHRGPLVHLLLAFPRWRPHTASALVVTFAAYAVSVVVPTVWLDDGATIGLGVGLIVAAGWNVRRTSGFGRHQRREALWASLVVGSALALGAVVRLMDGESAWLVALAAYDVALVAVPLLLLAGTAPARVDILRDLVIDLGAAREHPSRIALARALRDPDLVVAVWDREESSFLTAERKPVPLATPGRSTTPANRDGEPFILLVHDEALEGDPRLAEAVDVASRMEALNTAWHGEVASNAQRLAESRRRLLAAADDERGRLERELASGVEVRLDELGALLTDLDGAPDGHLSRAQHHLVGTREELGQLAAGLRPRALARGLEVAVQELAGSVPRYIEVAYDAGPLPDEIELAAYYVCAETLVNVAKHAPGATVAVAVKISDELLRVTVVDGGPGGATLTGSGGLLGLRDRVEALGGRLDVVSGAVGTRVTAELPLDHQPR